jgi:hypothetical protein
VRLITQCCPPSTAVPPELLAERRWVAWASVPQTDGKPPKKIPYGVHGGGAATLSNPSTWGSYQDAATMATLGDYAGVGFVLGDGFAGVDLDDCMSDAGTFSWGDDIVAAFGSTYGEVSPSGTGVKLFMRGRKPIGVRECKRVGVGPGGVGDVEVYDSGRWFAFTGEQLADHPLVAADCTAELAAVCARFFAPAAVNGHARVNGNANGTNAQPDPPTSSARTATPAVRLAVAAMLTATANVTDGGDGSRRLFTVACRAVELGLSDGDAMAAIGAYAKLQPFPALWSMADVVKRLRDAERRTVRGSAVVDRAVALAVRSVADVVAENPVEREPIIDGFIRVGETMNVVAASKSHKSYTVVGLLICVAMGWSWLGYATRRSRVLLIDNELYPSTIAARVRAVAHAMGIAPEELREWFHVVTLRGNLRNIYELSPMLDGIDPNAYGLIALDAMYRLLPAEEGAENSNSIMTGVYNLIDRCAVRLGCAFVVVHHSSKGVQGGKAVTDVGAGAGAQSRAVDAHLTIRPHEEDGAVVVEAVVRSFPPPPPICMRWTWPTWTLDPTLDPAMLQRERGKGGRPRKEEQQPVKVAKIQYTPAEFATAFVTAEPKPAAVVVAKAAQAGLSGRESNTLIALALDMRIVHKHAKKGEKTVYLATTEPALFAHDTHTRAPPTPPTGKRRKCRRSPGN